MREKIISAIFDFVYYSFFINLYLIFLSIGEFSLSFLIIVIGLFGLKQTTIVRILFQIICGVVFYFFISDLADLSEYGLYILLIIIPILFFPLLFLFKEEKTKNKDIPSWLLIYQSIILLIPIILFIILIKEVIEALFMLGVIILLFYQFFGNILLFSKKYKLGSYIKYSYVIMSLMILLSFSPNFSKETDGMAIFIDFMISLFGFGAIFLYYLPILIIQLKQFRSFKKEKPTLTIPFIFIILSLFLIIHKLVLCNGNLNCIITNKVYLNENQIEKRKEKRGVEKYYKESFSNCQNLKVLKHIKTKKHELYCNGELKTTIYNK